MKGISLAGAPVKIAQVLLPPQLQQLKEEKRPAVVISWAQERCLTFLLAMPTLVQAEWEKGYGTVLDSGTTFTYFTRDTFNSVSAVIKQHVVKTGLKLTNGPDPLYTDICWAGGPLNPAELRRFFPVMSFVLEDEFELHLEPINYLFIHTHLPGGYCLGLFDNGNSGTLLGGISFRNILVEVISCWASNLFCSPFIQLLRIRIVFSHPR
jgi:hypothetical protein